jgi:hypothetical protein
VGMNRGWGFLRGWIAGAIALVALSSLGGPRVARADEGTFVQVLFPDLQTRDQFLSEYPETEVRTERRIVRPELRVSAAALAELQRRGYPMQMLLGEPDGQAETLTPAAHNNIVTSHYTLAAYQDSLAALAARYPTLTREVVIGHSLQNRPIYALEVSDNPQVDEDEPVLVLAATIHSDEDVGLDVTLAFARGLLSSYGVDPGSTAKVNDSEIWLVPLLNPDGWMLLESGTVRDWRKNLHDNNGDEEFDTADGVDLNRNFSFNWEYGAAFPPTLPTYRGPSPFSEPEITGFRDLMSQIHPTVTLTYHQFGDVVIVPWLWNGRATPDSVTYRALASRIAGAITNLSGAPFGWYEDGQTAGFMDDWIYGTQGGFCFTVEITTNGLSTVDQAVTRNQGGISQAWSELNGPQITGHVGSAATGLPLDAEVEVLEIDTSQLLPRRTDPVTGRYRRLLVPGNYTLRVQAQGYLAVTTPFQVLQGPTVIDVLLPDSSLTTTSVAHDPGPALRLEAHPNPARERVHIGFDAGHAGPLRLDLHDLSGRRVRTLMDGVAAAGWSRVDWDGTDDSGRRLPTGVYVLRLARSGRVESRRIVWMR